ncbi:MAG TPA: hypothetical protein VIL24_02480 [Clostridia bacterium]
MKFSSISIFLNGFMIILTYFMAAIAFKTHEPLDMTAFIVCCSVLGVSIILTLLSARKNYKDNQNAQDKDK